MSNKKFSAFHKLKSFATTTTQYIQIETIYKKMSLLVGNSEKEKPVTKSRYKKLPTLFNPQSTETSNKIKMLSTTFTEFCRISTICIYIACKKICNKNSPTQPISYSFQCYKSNFRLHKTDRKCKTP